MRAIPALLGMIFAALTGFIIVLMWKNFVVDLTTIWHLLLGAIIGLLVALTMLMIGESLRSERWE